MELGFHCACLRKHCVIQLCCLPWHLLQMKSLCPISFGSLSTFIGLHPCFSPLPATLLSLSPRALYPFLFLSDTACCPPLQSSQLAFLCTLQGMCPQEVFLFGSLSKLSVLAAGTEMSSQWSWHLLCHVFSSFHLIEKMTSLADCVEEVWLQGQKKLELTLKEAIECLTWVYRLFCSNVRVSQGIQTLLQHRGCAKTMSNPEAGEQKIFARTLAIGRGCQRGFISFWGMSSSEQVVLWPT